MARLIEIVGAGLAGLALSVGLAGRGVPVRLLESGRVPRARLCGEFICGVEPSTLEVLGVQGSLAGALRVDRVEWHRGGAVARTDRLACPAWCLPRPVLDTRLLEAAKTAGVVYQPKTRAQAAEDPAGQVWAAGRPRRKAPWMGLKAHYRGLPELRALELHFGRGAYCGVAPIGGGLVNVCGLFPVGALRERAGLDGALRQYGLAALAERLAAVEAVPGSEAAGAGYRFGWSPPPASGALAVGDAAALIPPFTGNGMSMAFEGAEAALGPLRAWAEGRVPWAATVAEARRALRRRFARRLLVARAMHPFLRLPAGQSILLALSRLRGLPFGPLFALTHA